MEKGTIDLLVLIIIFLGLQAWWIVPIFRRNNKPIEKGHDINHQIKQLERIFKK